MAEVVEPVIDDNERGGAFEKAETTKVSLGKKVEYDTMSEGMMMMVVVVVDCC